MKLEEKLQASVCQWMSYQYPDVIFISEASGVRMSMGMAIKLKKTRSHGTHLDLYILEPCGTYKGLFLELKAVDIFYKGTRNLKKNEHVEDQARMIKRLRKKGYASSFALGFDEASKIIKSYMDGTYYEEGDTL